MGCGLIVVCLAWCKGRSEIDESTYAAIALAWGGPVQVSEDQIRALESEIARGVVRLVDPERGLGPVLARLTPGGKQEIEWLCAQADKRFGSVRFAKEPWKYLDYLRNRPARPHRDEPLAQLPGLISCVRDRGAIARSPAQRICPWLGSRFRTVR